MLMKNSKTWAAIVAGALAAIAAAPSWAIPILSVEPSAEKIGVGQTLLVDVNISGLGSGTAPSLGAFDLRLVYNPFVLDFVTLGFGDQLDVLGLGTVNGFAEDPDPTVGAVDFFEISLDLPSDLENLQADSFLLARIAFTGLGKGSSSLNLALPDLSDAFGNSLSAVVVPGSVKVPEPGTLTLLILGLAGIGLVLRRQKVATQSRVICEERCPSSRAGLV